MSGPPVLTVDGPVGSGKGTVSQRVAAHLGWHLLDSGALYRATALAVLRAGHDVEHQAAAAEASARDLDVAFVPGQDGVRVLLAGDDVTERIREEDCSQAASVVASLTGVRQALLERQRAFRGPPGLVADGRDMGTVVFPDAGVKIFLTASAEERARRRYKQLKDKGIGANLRDLVSEIAKRDERDAHRAVAPLEPAVDAVVLDTTALDVDQAVARVLDLARERWGQAVG